MAFDKVEYRKNREVGLRGQGQMPEPPPQKRQVTRQDGSIISKKRHPDEYEERLKELQELGLMPKEKQDVTKPKI